MFISAGILKHLKLVFPQDRQTRSTKSILRQSFFNSNKYDLSDCIFVEAFGGSGSMGLEALSLGARSAIFFEINTNALKCLAQNIANANKLLSINKNIKLDTKVIANDFFNSYEYLKKLSGRTCIYLDPPFAIRDGFSDVYVRLFRFFTTLENPNIFALYFECMSELELPGQIGVFCLQKERKFGKSKWVKYLSEITT